MAQIHPVTELYIGSPLLIEGLPWVGLVGTVAGEHLIGNPEGVAETDRRLAKRMRDAKEESTTATGMYG